MPGPYDSHGKKVNEVNMYDVFGSHNDIVLVSGAKSCDIGLAHSFDNQRIASAASAAGIFL